MLSRRVLLAAVAGAACVVPEAVQAAFIPDKERVQERKFLMELFKIDFQNFALKMRNNHFLSMINERLQAEMLAEMEEFLKTNRWSLELQKEHHVIADVDLVMHGVSPRITPRVYVNGRFKRTPLITVSADILSSPDVHVEEEHFYANQWKA